MAVKGIWRVFMSKFGNVRVDFAQPFSLQVFMFDICNALIVVFLSTRIYKSLKDYEFVTIMMNSKPDSK